jgi:hypothetical protein
MPNAFAASAAAALLALSSAAVALANRGVSENGNCRALWLAIPLLVAGWATSFAAQWGVSPTESAYGAIVYAFVAVDAFFALSAAVLALFALARRAAGRLDRVRRVVFDNARLFWHYTVAQTLVGLLLLHGFPRLVPG